MISVSPREQIVSVEMAGVEPATLCVQNSAPSRRHPQCLPPESNRLLPLFRRTRRPLTQERRSARGGNRTHLHPLDRRIASPEAFASKVNEGDGGESNPYLAVHSRALSPLSYHHHMDGSFWTRPVFLFQSIQ